MTDDLRHPASQAFMSPAMIIVPYRKTMASAKVYVEPTPPPAVDRRSQQAAERVVARQRQNAADAIAFANARLRALRTPKTGMDLICQRMCCALGVTMQEVRAISRTNHDATLARQGIAYWARRRLGMSLAQIGAFIGRDHTVTLHCLDAYPVKRAKVGRFVRPVR